MVDVCHYEIFKNDTYGRYAVASKDLDPGDLITTEVPFTYGPKSDSSVICLGCHSGVDGKTMCSVCGWPVCNDLCEKLPIHSENECIIFSKAKIKFTPVKDLTQQCPQYECIMPLRLLLLKEKDSEKWEKEVAVLESHCNERKKTDMWRVEEVNVVGFLHKVCHLQDRFSSDLIHFVCGILEVNAFVAPNGYGFDMRCVYLKASLLSHSCVPNVGHYIFFKSENCANFRMFVRAMIPIKKGEELFLTYTQTLSSTYFRRAHLREGKYFDCNCQRCTDPTELGTNLSTLKCTNCEKGWVMSVNSLDDGAAWKCTCCGCEVKAEEIFRKIHYIQEEAEEIQFQTQSDPVACREAFILKHLTVLHPNHAIIMGVKSCLTQLYGNTEGYLLKNLSEFFLKRKIELCYEIEDIANKIKPGISRQRGWNLYELYGPLLLLTKNKLHQKEDDEQGNFEEVIKILKEIVLIFSYEDPQSPEGVAGQKALQTLKELNALVHSK